MPKKRANGEGSIRKKPSGRWEGRYTQGIDPKTGRAIQKSVSARTQAECKEKLARAIRDNRGIPVNYNEDYTCLLYTSDLRTNFYNGRLHCTLYSGFAGRQLQKRIFAPGCGSQHPKKRRREKLVHGCHSQLCSL